MKNTIDARIGYRSAISEDISPHRDLNNTERQQIPEDPFVLPECVNTEGHDQVGYRIRCTCCRAFEFHEPGTGGECPSGIEIRGGGDNVVARI